MPLMKAVFLKILSGYPTSLSFFTTSNLASSSRAVPVSATRNPAYHHHPNQAVRQLSQQGHGCTVRWGKAGRVSTPAFLGMASTLQWEEACDALILWWGDLDAFLLVGRP